MYELSVILSAGRFQEGDRPSPGHRSGRPLFGAIRRSMFGQTMLSLAGAWRFSSTIRRDTRSDGDGVPASAGRDCAAASDRSAAISTSALYDAGETVARQLGSAARRGPAVRCDDA